MGHVWKTAFLFSLPSLWVFGNERVPSLAPAQLRWGACPMGPSAAWDPSALGPSAWSAGQGAVPTALFLLQRHFSRISHFSASPAARGHKSNLMISLKGLGGGLGGGKIGFLPSARVLYEILWEWATTLRPILWGEGTFSSSLPTWERGPPQYSFCSAVAAVGAPAPENRPF